MSASKTVTVTLKFASDAADAERQMKSLAQATTQAASSHERLNASRKSGRQAGTYGLRDDFVGRDDVYGFARSGAVAGGGAAAGLPPWMRAARDRAETEADRMRREMERADRDRRSRVLGSLGAQRQAELAREAAERRREATERFAELERIDRRHEHDNPLRGTSRFYDRQAVAAEAGYRDRLDAARALHARGLNPDGSPQVGLDRYLSAPPGDRGRLDSLAPFAARVAGRLAAPVAAVAAYGRDVTMAAQVDATPFATDRQKAEMRLRQTGFGIVGAAAGAFLDFQRARSGATAIVGKARESALYQEEAIARHGEAVRYGADVVARLGAASDQVDSHRGLRLDRPPIVDQRTAAGERQLRDAERLLPVQRELTRLAAVRAGHEATLKRATADEAESAERLREIDRDRGVLRASIRENEFGSVQRADVLDARSEQRRVTSERAKSDLTKLDAKRAEEQKRYDEASGRRGEAESDLRGTVQAQRQRQIEDARNRAGMSKERAELAAEGAVRLSRAGVAGRQLGLAGLDLIKRVGVDYTPRDLLDAARQLDPTGVGKAEEAAGEKFKPEVRRRALDPTAPELQDTEAARATRRADREKADALVDSDIGKTVDEGVLALKRLADNLPIVFNKVIAELERFERQMGAINAGTP